MANRGRRIWSIKVVLGLFKDILIATGIRLEKVKDKVSKFVFGQEI